MGNSIDLAGVSAIKLEWLLRTLDLDRLATNDVYGLDYFLEKFSAWTSYQIGGAINEISPEDAKGPEQIAEMLDTAERLLQARLREIPGYRAMLEARKETIRIADEEVRRQKRDRPVNETNRLSISIVTPPEDSQLQTLRSIGDDMFYMHSFSHSGLDNPAAIRLGDEILELSASGRFREAAARFTHAIPITPALNLNDARWEPVARYNAAMAYALGGDYRRARHHMEMSRLPISGHHTNYTYAERLAIACRNVHEQTLAIKRGCPSILITALEKSASTFISGSLSRIMQVPVVCVALASLQEATGGFVIGSWAKQANLGGVVTHEHYSAFFENVDVLCGAGVKTLFVQFRDPRAALWSYINQRIDQSDILPTLADPHSFMQTRYTNMIAWIKSWMDARQRRDVEVHFVFYDDVRTRPSQVLSEILNKVGFSIGEDAVGLHLDAAIKQGRRPDNFRLGDPEDWRRHITPELQAWFWEETPAAVRDLLGMRP
jgi:Sulfotransferase domain